MEDLCEGFEVRVSRGAVGGEHDDDGPDDPSLCRGPVGPGFQDGEVSWVQSVSAFLFPRPPQQFECEAVCHMQCGAPGSEEGHVLGQIGRAHV